MTFFRELYIVKGFHADAGHDGATALAGGVL